MISITVYQPECCYNYPKQCHLHLVITPIIRVTSAKVTWEIISGGRQIIESAYAVSSNSEYLDFNDNCVNS